MTENTCQTRFALLDAAETLFSSCGYDAVGIRDIAAHANTNLASIKYHFGSKRNLYLETVNHALTRPGRAGTAWQLLQESPAPLNQGEAAAILARFIRVFFTELLCSTGDDSCVLLIIREGMQPSEAIESVVDEYIRPNQELLITLVRVFKPDASESELASDAQSVLGQMMHYRVFRAVIEKLNGRKSDSGNVDELAVHVTRFSLRGLGCDETVIDSAITCATDVNIDALMAQFAQGSSS